MGATQGPVGSRAANLCPLSVQVGQKLDSLGEIVTFGLVWMETVWVFLYIALSVLELAM